MNRLAPLAVLALACLLPTAVGQDVQGVTISPGTVPEVAYQGNGTIPFNASVGCAEVAKGQSATFTATVLDSPAWLTATPTSIELSPADCVTGSGRIPVTGAIAFRVSKDAPGVLPQAVAVIGSVGDIVSAGASSTIRVAYNVDYRVVPELTFPYTVTTPEVVFKVTNTQASNARSMIMIEEVSATAGTFAGLPSTVYESQAGVPASLTFDATFKAPAGAWTNATVSFKAYGHYLLLETGESNDYSPAQVYSWEFVNGGVATDDGNDKKGKDSPPPLFTFLAIGLLGLAAARRRKA